MMYFLKFCCLFFVFLSLASNLALAQTLPGTPHDSTGQVLNPTWKVALMTGDDEIDAFDNARKTLTNVFLKSGITPANIRELSMNPAERRSGVLPSSQVNLARALQDLSVGEQDACLIHM